MKINLVIVQPEHYVHSLGFLDAAVYFQHWLVCLGNIVSISKNKMQHDAVNILFGAHLGIQAGWIGSEYCTFILNLEQVGEGGAALNNNYLNLLKSELVIDYHPDNVWNYRSSEFSNVPLIHFLNAPYLNPDPLSLDLSTRPIDLLFFGSLNAERKAFLKRVERKGWDIAVFDSPTYFEERDEYVRQAKAVINMSYYTSARFEQVRAFNVLSQGTAFISYLLPEQSISFDFREPVFWITDANFDKFFEKEFSTHDWFHLAKDKYLSWINTDPRSEFNNLLSVLDLAWTKHVQIKNLVTAKPVRIVQFDKSTYFQDAVNISPNKNSDADLLIDLLEKQDWPWSGLSKRGKLLEFQLGQIEHILIHDKSLDSTKWYALLTNAMDLLCESGVLILEIPIEEVKIHEDGCRLLMSYSTLLTFTEQFWRSGQWSYRFEFKSYQLINEQRQSVDLSLATTCRLIFEKRSTTSRERTLARVHLPDFGIGK